MKPYAYSNLKLKLCIWSLFLLNAGYTQAQICSNEKDTLYGLSTTGVIYPININNGGVGTPLDSLTTGVAPVNTNGMGFSKATGKFYYFERIGTALPSPVFMSYNSATKTTTALASPTLTSPTTNKIRSGCINNGQTGYYTIEPTFSATNAALHYYNIATNTWTVVSTNFTDPAGTSLNATFHGLNSGDMSFDGIGNLWIVCSSTTQYALYKIPAPVPTAGLVTIKATQIIPVTPTPTAGKGITGVAFNSAGTLFLTTGAGDNKIYKLSTTTSSLTFVATMAKDDIGADLTSCSMPFGVLSSSWQEFKGVMDKNVELTWTVFDEPEVSGYQVERSNDGEHWEAIAFIEKKGSAATAVKYNYTDLQYAGKMEYYRIAKIWPGGGKSFSTTIYVQNSEKNIIHVGPNPTTNVLYLSSLDHTKYMAQIFDRNGRLMLTTVVGQSKTIAVDQLKRGTYVLKLVSVNDQHFTSYTFVKW